MREYCVVSDVVDGVPFTDCFVHVGQVTVRNRKLSGPSTIVRAGQWTRVLGNAPPTKPAPIVDHRCVEIDGTETPSGPALSAKTGAPAKTTAKKTSKKTAKKSAKKRTVGPSSGAAAKKGVKKKAAKKSK